MNSLNKYILTTPSLLLISRCSSTKVHYEIDKKYEPTRSVDILDRKPPEPYTVNTTLEASAPRYDNGQFVFNKMRQKAQKIGAHAIVPIEFREIPGRIDISTGAYLKQPKEWGKANAL